MTPKELIAKIVACEGPCGRMCAYCPEDFNTAEVKACVEKLIEENYALESDKDRLMKDFLKLSAAYRNATGHYYKGEE